jgi:basic membrane protein A
MQRIVAYFGAMIERTLVRLGALLCAFALAACTKHETVAPVKIALVVPPAGSGYDAYAEQARSGLDTCARDTGATFETGEPGNEDEAERAVVLAATTNDAVVIGLGYPLTRPIARAAIRFDATHFAIVDAVVAGPNVESLTFDERQAGYLAGALAALASKHGHVAFLAGSNDPLFKNAESGFQAGARAADPRVRVTIASAGSFSDVRAGERAARALYASGADVVYAVAGKAGTGVFTAARDARGYAIAADTDQNASAPGIVLASIVKDVARVTERICLDAVSQKAAVGHRVLGIADGALAVVTSPALSDALGPGKRARFEALERALERAVR